MLQDICPRHRAGGRLQIAWVGFAMDDDSKSVEPMALSGADESTSGDSR